ncbi:MAG: GDP-mannose 4,6-dehydratase [Bacteroidota bacterium]
MKKILVTGCAGFIGSSLTDALLNKGFSVIGIDNFDTYYSKSLKQDNLKNAFQNKNFSFVEGDICSVTDLKKIDTDVDLVVHLAAKAGVRPSIENPEAYVNTNIVGTQNILNWMKTNSISKLVFSSSSSVYGNNSKTPFSENDNVDKPISPYAFTKKSCELLNYTFHHLYNFDIINLRFFTVFGPRQRPDLAIRKFVDLILKNEAIPVFGDGNTGRDYTYIDDIVQGIINSIEYLVTNKNVYEIINLGNSSPIKLIELVTEIYTILGKQKNINFLPMQEGDVDLTFADISKAKKLLNYAPTVSLKQGLANFINWYEATK